MLKKFFSFLSVFALTLSLCSCTFSENGESITAFSNRMNSYNESYNMSSDGYIFDKDESSFTRFFKFSEEEVMLRLVTDEKNRATQLHIVFNTGATKKNTDISVFVENSLKSFCQDEKIYDTLCEQIDLKNILATPTEQTLSAEYGNIVLKTDITEIGTVISIYKDI